MSAPLVRAVCLGVLWSVVVVTCAVAQVPVGPDTATTILPITSAAFDAIQAGGACTPRASYLVTDWADATLIDWACPASGIGPLLSKQGGGESAAPPAGISAPGFVRYMRHTVVDLNQNTSLCLHNRINADTGAAGITLTLPSLADVAAELCASEFHIAHTAGAGSLTLAPHASDLINTSSDSRTVNGIGTAEFHADARTTFWRVFDTGAVPTGGFVGIDTDNTMTGDNTFSGATNLSKPVYVACGGDTNNSSSGSGSEYTHSLAYTIPANTLTNAKHGQFCAAFAVTTGSSAPTMTIRFKLGTTSLGTNSAVTPSNNLSARGFAYCYDFYVTEAPGDTADIYSFPRSNPNALNTGQFGNFNTAMPLNHDTNSSLSASITTTWSAAGTGTNTITQHCMSLILSN